MNMIDHALYYYAEGLCVIPVKERDKAPALDEWEEYQFRRSTSEEIIQWWTRNPNYNIGLAHGVNGFATLDIDDDKGIFQDMRDQFPELMSGRIEQSGSGDGFHIPLLLQEYPDLGYDNSKERPKGNRTWGKLSKKHLDAGNKNQGSVNIRARWCQTVAPPSVHPSGGIYRVISPGCICRISNLNRLIGWLNTIYPQAKDTTPKTSHNPNSNHSRIEIKDYYPDLISACRMIGIAGEAVKDKGEIRILGNGGLMIDESKGRWYSFTDEMGGDVIDLFGWSKFGTAWNRYNKRQFSEVVEYMKALAGVGTTRTIAREWKGKATPKWGDKLPGGYWA